jgi:hypothetical protein
LKCPVFIEPQVWPFFHTANVLGYLVKLAMSVIQLCTLAHTSKPTSNREQVTRIGPELFNYWISL